jgi:hypothetical protein
VHKGETATSDQADMVGTLVVTGGRSYEVGELAFGADGRVYPRPEGEPVLFRFRYEGVAFDAELPADRAAPLVLSACPGVLPYSAETPTGRRAVLTLLKTAAPARGQLFLDRGGRLHLRFADHAPSPRTPVHVMATLVSLLLEVQPYLRLLRACNALRASA